MKTRNDEPLVPFVDIQPPLVDTSNGSSAAVPYAETGFSAHPETNGQVHPATGDLSPSNGVPSTSKDLHESSVGREALTLAMRAEPAVNRVGQIAKTALLKTTQLGVTGSAMVKGSVVRGLEAQAARDEQRQQNWRAVHKNLPPWYRPLKRRDEITARQWILFCGGRLTDKTDSSGDATPAATAKSEVPTIQRRPEIRRTQLRGRTKKPWR